MIFSRASSFALCTSKPVQCYFCSYARNVSTSDHVDLLGRQFKRDDWTNVTPKIIEKTERRLLQVPNHPLNTVKQRIVNYFHQKFGGYAGSSSPLFSSYDDFSPIVQTEQNFDDLLIPKDHVSRSKSDNYYITKDWVLRAHTSAHQTELIRAGLPAFLVFGDVYRRDEIDSTHFPVFHQCEGVRLFTKYQLFPNADRVPGLAASGAENVPSEVLRAELFANHERTVDHQELISMEASKMLEYDLKSCLEDLLKYLFWNDSLQMRWVDVYFPFTHPSWELEILHEGKWIEVLGCGVVEQKLMKNAGCPDRVGWAFGIGLERIAMLLYQIPDIRLFWSQDERFLDQFVLQDSKNIDERLTFKPFSNFMPLYNDISFWLNPDVPFSDNDFYDIVRNVGTDLVENVNCFDTYQCKKTNRTSKAFRLTFRHFEKQLTQDDVNSIKIDIEKSLAQSLGVTIR